MSWNYRVVKFTSQTPICFGLFEVYYNEDGLPWARTNRPITVGESAEELISDLKTMIKDAENSPVMEEPIKWGEQPFAGPSDDDISIDEFIEELERGSDGVTNDAKGE